MAGSIITFGHTDGRTHYFLSCGLNWSWEHYQAWPQLTLRTDSVLADELNVSKTLTSWLLDFLTPWLLDFLTSCLLDILTNPGNIKSIQDKSLSSWLLVFLISLTSCLLDNLNNPGNIKSIQGTLAPWLLDFLTSCLLDILANPCNKSIQWTKLQKMAKSLFLWLLGSFKYGF